MIPIEHDVRIVRVAAVVIVHHITVPDLTRGRAECARIESLIDEIGRPAAILMVLDRVLPPASAAVREVYRESAERTSISIWAGVVGGVMGFAASIATSIAAQVFARQPVPMRVFRSIPTAVAWMGAGADLGAEPAEVADVARCLRAQTFIGEVRKVG